MLCAALCATTLTGCTDKKGADLDNNPLMKESTLPLGAPDFSKIKTEHFLPAMKAGIEQHCGQQRLGDIREHHSGL